MLIKKKTVTDQSEKSRRTAYCSARCNFCLRSVGIPLAVSLLCLSFRPRSLPAPPEAVSPAPRLLSASHCTTPFSCLSGVCHTATLPLSAWLRLRLCVLHHSLHRWSLSLSRRFPVLVLSFWLRFTLPTDRRAGDHLSLQPRLLLPLQPPRHPALHSKSAGKAFFVFKQSRCCGLEFQ